MATAEKSCPSGPYEKGVVVLATRPYPDHVFLVELAVAPAHQGRGLGRAALSRALATAQESGAASVWLVVSNGNVPAIGLYRASGSTPVRRLTSCHWARRP